MPRHGFFQLDMFAMAEAERSFSYMPEGVGGLPERNGIEERFEIFIYHNQKTPGVRFLRNCVSYVRDQLGYSAGDFIHEMTQGILGCMYPVPDRMLTLSEKIVAAYIREEMVGNTQSFCGNFDLFAVEGGTAAISYLFTSLKENRLLKPGDAIGIGLPIFTPYIEIPELADFELREVSINAGPENNWQYTRKELEKLLDPKVKAFFLVNPSNPPSVKLSDECLRMVADIVKKRPDLLLLTDDVYGTFADNFTSLFAICPHNTILVYSFSKYFCSTGWRLGVIATHEDNVMDRRKAALYKEAPVAPPHDPNDVDYYHLLDMEIIGKQMYEPEFITWLLKRLKPNEFLFTLASKASVVLLPSSGFGGPAHPSARVSLANLNDSEYVKIVKALKELMDGYHQEYLKGKSGKKKK